MTKVFLQKDLGDLKVITERKGVEGFFIFSHDNGSWVLKCRTPEAFSEIQLTSAETLRALAKKLDELNKEEK